MNRYKLIIEKIKDDWEIHESESFSDDQKEFERNKFEKTKIQDLIIQIHQDEKLLFTEKKSLTTEAILLLASISGCAEDLEIAEEILDYLENKKLIDQTHFDMFYDNSSTKRWFL